jgi:hypothetical protein
MVSNLPTFECLLLLFLYFKGINPELTFFGNFYLVLATTKFESFSMSFDSSCFVSSFMESEPEPEPEPDSLESEDDSHEDSL